MTDETNLIDKLTTAISTKIDSLNPTKDCAHEYTELAVAVRELAVARSNLTTPQKIEEILNAVLPVIHAAVHRTAPRTAESAAA